MNEHQLFKIVKAENVAVGYYKSIKAAKAAMKKHGLVQARYQALLDAAKKLEELRQEKRKKRPGCGWNSYYRNYQAQGFGIEKHKQALVKRREDQAKFERNKKIFGEFVNGWICYHDESVSYDNNRYSKSWHRRYGGAKTVDARYVVFEKWDESKKQLERKRISVDRFSGFYREKAALEAGIIETCNAPGLKNVQLQPWFTVKLMRENFGFKLYTRRFGDKLVDYCLVYGKVTSHEKTLKKCFDQLRIKLQKKGVIKNAIINFDFCRSLGFCAQGIKSFCHDYGLDINGAYTPKQIHEKIMENWSRASTYEYELRKLAETVGYKIEAA